MISNAESLHSLTASILNRVYEKETNKLYGYTLMVNDGYYIIPKNSLLEKVRSSQLHLSNAKVCKDGKVVSLYNSYIPISNMDRKAIMSFGTSTVVQLFCTSGKITCAVVYEKGRLMDASENTIGVIQVQGFPLGYNVAVGKIFSENLRNNFYSNCRLSNDKMCPSQRYTQFDKTRKFFIDVLKLNRVNLQSLPSKIEVKAFNDRTYKISLKKLPYNEVLMNIMWALIYDRLNAEVSFITDRFDNEELVISASFGANKIGSIIENAFKEI